MKTNLMFVNEVENSVTTEYVFLEAYQGALTPILVMHNSEKCNYHAYSVRPNDFLRGKRCAKCSGKYKRNHNDFITELNDLYGNEYQCLNEFKNTDTKVLIKHLCGFEWEVLPLSILRKKSSCPNCSNKRFVKPNRLTFNKVKVFVESNGYKLVSNEYINARSPLTIECPESHEFEMNYNNFQQGQRCPTCRQNELSSKQRTPEEEIMKEVEKHNFTFLGWVDSYENNSSKFILECPNGHVSTKSVKSFIRHKGCTHCNKPSKGEERIYNCLQSHSISFKTQYKFEDCKNVRPLPFDFAVFNGDDIVCLIEFDGRQHFEPVEHFGGLEAFNVRAKNDQIKNEYCKLNNLKLIRISYLDFKLINQILQKEFME